MTSAVRAKAPMVAQPTAADLMTSAVLTVDASAAVGAVWELLQRERAEHVVVLQGASCVGIVDLRDLWAAWAFDLDTPARRNVGHVCSATPHVHPGTPLPILCRALLRAPHGAVLVLAADGSLRGVVCWYDVLAWVAQTGSQSTTVPGPRSQS